MDILNTLFNALLIIVVGVGLGLIIAGIIGAIVLGIIKLKKRLQRE